MNEFSRISRLPPYVFNIVNDLKAKARAAGEDIIDFGMGNPDSAPPQNVMEELSDYYESGGDDDMDENDDMDDEW